MIRDEDSTKKSAPKAMPQRVLRFFDRNFDWLVLVFITLLILLVFVFF